MMLRLAATLCVGLAVSAGPQARPDFSGRWVPADKPAATEVLTVVQNEAELRATLTDGNLTERVHYTFSGPAVQDVNHPNVTVTSVASWKGSTLEVTTTFKATDSGTVMSVRTETWSLDAGRLVIDTSSVRPNSPPRSSRASYLRR